MASIYLDHAATTPLRPEAREAWIEASTLLGNPSSIHGAGQASRRLLEESRERIAQAVGADPVEIVLTSGGTEAVNLGIGGLWHARRAAGAGVGIVVPEAEHHATLDSVSALATAGAAITAVGVDADSVIGLDAWHRAVAAPETAVATLLAANNETGALQPLGAALSAAADAGVPVHVDAVGAFGHVPLRFAELHAQGAAAMSLAAHKIGGPVGVGALVVARDAVIEPMIRGGGQQRGLRAGTQDAAGAAAFAVAAELAVAELDAEAARVSTLRDRLEARVRQLAPDARVSAAGVARLPGHLHVIFPGAQGDGILLLLDLAGIAVSTGSACQAGTPEPSHVVRAMGLGEEAARCAVRFALGRTTTADDVDAVLAALPDALERARRAGLSSRTV